MNYQEFQRQVESTSRLSDWKYYKGESDFSYFRAMRNNDQFRVIYSASDHRYDWTAERNGQTTRIAQDCFTLQDAIDFLNTPIVINEPKRRELGDMDVEAAIALLLIGLAIGWISAIATVQIPTVNPQSSAIERS